MSEYMAGGDLETLLREADGDGLPLVDALRIATEVCQALEHAHGHGILHRDLKPGNIWLTEDRTAKLGDFGFALTVDRSRLTQAGMMVGTPYCMPPEQALGGEVTVASDLYSLGCVLYEMVAGRPPFPGDDPTAVISQHINNAPVAPSWYTDHCPPDLEELILHLLAKAPGDRPATATEVRGALERIFPELRRLPGIVEPAEQVDPEAAQFRLFDAYTTFVRAMAARSPLLIALDDLHWTGRGR